MASQKTTTAVVIAGLCAFALAGCNTMSGTLFPDKAAPLPDSPVPQAGTSFFAPVPVTPGVNTGTPQSQRIAELRSRLVALQGEIAARNASLSEIRQKTAGEAALYRIAKSEVISAAPPPPAKAVTQAQSSLERFASATAALDAEMRIFARGAAEANKLMTDSLAVREANEQDQNQLNILRAEIGNTANQLDRLVNEISNEWALQSAFLAKERASLAALGFSQTPAPTGSIAAGATPGIATAAMLASPAFVTIKFDRANVSYREALATAVSQAKRRKPDAAFDVVGVTAGRAIATEATQRAQEVATTLASLGVDTARIRLFNAASMALQTPEVRIYAR